MRCAGRRVVALALGAALVTAVALAPRSASATTPAQQLAEAKQKFLAGDYPVSINILSSLLYPRPQLTDPGQLAEAHLLLGVSYFETGNKKGAESEFEEALFLNAKLEVQPPFFSTEASDAFGEVKDRVIEKQKRDEEKRRRAQEAAAMRRMLENSLTIEKRNYYLNLVGFGLGQFQNGHRKKGIALFATEVSLAALSSGLFLYQSITYGFSGTVPRDEVSLVNRIQTVQLVSAGLFFAAYIYGTIDSLYYYKATVTRQADPDFLRRLRELEEADGDEDDGKTSVLDPDSPDKRSVILAPTIAPNSIGLSFGMEF